MHGRAGSIRAVTLALLVGVLAVVGAAANEPEASVHLARASGVAAAVPAAWPSVATSAEPLPAYDRLFYRESGWTGADNHTSVPLGGDRYLWLWGDSGSRPIKDRWYTCYFCLKRNTIAIQRGGDPATASVGFSFGSPDPGSPGEPGAFFKPEGDPDPAKNWFWPGDGVRTAQGLYLFLTRGVQADGHLFGKYAGTWLARIPNPDDPPARWRVGYQRLPLEVFKVAAPVPGQPAEHVGWGMAVLEARGHLYLYGARNVPSAPGALGGSYMMLARTEPAAIGDFHRWEFYDFAGAAWRTIGRDAAPGSVEPGAGPYMAPAYSVHYQPSLRRYVTVNTVLGISADIVVRYADSPAGPWSPAQLVYRCPEAGLDRRVTCYAAQGHQELARSDDEIVISYSTMNDTVGTYADPRGRTVQRVGQLREAVYGFPRFVRLRLPGVAGRVEGERLVYAASATAPVAAQPNSAGTSWSGTGQLRFQARQPGDYLEVPFEVGGSGVYAVSIAQARAPDHGRTIAAVDGQQVTKVDSYLGRMDFDGYGAAVTTETVENEPICLATGWHVLRLTVTGKASASAGYLAGIDHLSARRTSRCGPFRIEAETRLDATMAGQYAELAFEVPASGHYDVTLGQSEFREYGTNAVTIDGRAIGRPFDAHSPTARVTPVGYGTVHLAAGRHLLRTTVTGKSATATGYRAGIDYLDLRPVLLVEAGALLQDPAWYKPGSGTAVAVQRSAAPVSWSGGGQLWMRSTRPGQYVDMAVDVPVTGDYDLTVAQTEAPGYGINAVTVDGRPVGQPFDAHHPSARITEVGYGRVRLTAGSHRLRATVTGKDPASAGYFAGIDHILLRPVPSVAVPDRVPIGWEFYRLPVPATR
jgi:Domain of unknown function (DUF4185)